MSKRARSHRPALSLFHTRAAIVTVGLGASAALGAGVAAAADSPAAAAPAPSSSSAQSVQTQAAAQQNGADKTDTVKKQAAAKAVSWVKPVDTYKLSASYAQAGGMWSHKHSGQDFAVKVGTGVNAVHAGTVVKAGGNGAGDGPAYGNAIVIKHGKGLYSQYAHLSRVDVHVGESVKSGEHIARSGNTGNSSGPHLHFEIRTSPSYGSAVNPVPFLKAHGLKL